MISVRRLTFMISIVFGSFLGSGYTTRYNRYLRLYLPHVTKQSNTHIMPLSCKTHQNFWLFKKIRISSMHFRPSITLSTVANPSKPPPKHWKLMPSLITSIDTFVPSCRRPLKAPAYSQSPTPEYPSRPRPSAHP